LSQTVDPAAEPRDEVREAELARVTDALGAAALETHLKAGDDMWVRVDASAWRTVAETLRGLGYTYFCFLSAIDWMPSPFGKGEDDPTEPAPERDMTVRQGYAGGATRFQMLARLVQPRTSLGINIKADVPEDTMSVETWSGVFSGANWHEREAHEMFGIGFAGHPDLRNMYLPTDFEGNPLRKDFPLLARMVKPWPGIVDVEPLPGDDGEDEES
jgi:NADH-quinone oxidoreductase subunit C